MDEVTDFEKLLLRTFQENSNPMQLVKILKRKLSVNNPLTGAKNLKVIDEMLEREPLRKYVLYAKKFYESNLVFEQIGKVNGLKGSEQKVYQNDPDYWTFKKKLASPKQAPQKLSYFQQQLKLKHKEAQFQQNQNEARKATV